MDAIASIFVNYHEAPGVGTEWKDDASAEDEGRSRKHLSARGAATPPDGFGATSMLLIQFVVLPRKMGTGRDSLGSRREGQAQAQAAVKKKSAKAKNAAGAAPHAPVSAPPAARPPRRQALGDDRAAARSRPGPGRGGRAAAAPLPKIRVFPQLSEVQKARLRMKDQEHIRRGARLQAVTQEQERNAFLERIQAEEVRREQARIAAARPVPPPPNRATGAGDDSDEGWEESDEDDPVEDLIHRERIRERDLLRTPGCLALGRKAFRLEDMPRVTERDREILRRVLYILREAERPSTRSRSTRTSSSRVDMEVRRSTVGVYEDSLACQLLGQTYYVHPDKTIKITVDLVVTSEVIGAFSVAAAVVPRARSLRARPPETLKTARKNVVEVRSASANQRPATRVVSVGRGEYQLALSNYRQMELWCFFKLDMALLARPTLAGVIRKFANAIARKAAEARGETFVPTPYDETAVDAVVVTAVPPVAPVATLVADGAKKVVFQYGRPGNGTDYLVARWRGLAETDPLRLEFDELARRDVAAAAADELPVDRLQRAPDPGLVNLPTIWPRMRFPVRVATPRRRATEALSRVQEALRSLENAFSEFMPVSIQEKHRISEVVVERIEEVNVESAVAEKPLPPLHVAGASRRLERYKADFALQLKDLAYVEAADEAYLRDQAAALAPPEPMPDGSRPPIDAHSRRVARAGLANTFERMIGAAAARAKRGQARRRVRSLAPPGQPRRVAKLYVVPNCEIVSPPPPPIYHVTENGERLLVLCGGVQRPLIPAIQQAIWDQNDLSADFAARGDSNAFAGT
ncbi:hypothetical protein JL721_10551 [Aureococcus anophagefferens]|nr:hypothetical protein JL721_10551 [Aureococcus anophagefferens]